ncbi:hypothetical protein SDC9_73812 [bioreactor metagenome]|uniref:Uncharacterized protein n=1 Tax=bioreactor metagenome TaxID=1076179 RepID=A0A644YFB8_9ZZZZ
MLEHAEYDHIGLGLQLLGGLPVLLLVRMKELDKELGDDIVETADQTIGTVGETREGHLITARVNLEVRTDFFLDSQYLMVRTCRVFYLLHAGNGCQTLDRGEIHRCIEGDVVDDHGKIDRSADLLVIPHHLIG